MDQPSASSSFAQRYRRAARVAYRLAAIVFALAFEPQTFAQADRPLLIEGVTVIPMDEDRTIADQSVLIEEGRIARIAALGGITRPPDVEVIDGRGKFLMPGLAEMHAHVPGGDDAALQYQDDVLFLYLANGVTLARGMLGHPIHLETRGRLARGEIPGPRLVTSGPGFNRWRISTPGDAIKEVREQAESGYDFLKIFGGFPVETFDALAEAADGSGLPMAGHVPDNVGVPRALELGFATIDHFDQYMSTLVDPDRSENVQGGFFGYHLAPFVEEERIREMAQRTRDSGVWNVPTESIMRSAFVVDLERVRDERPEFRYLPAEVVEGWFEWVTNFRASEDYDQEAGEAFIQVRLKLIKAMHEAGAGLLLGSDAPQWFNVPGFSLHREMLHMQEAGLTPFEVLKTGTVNPAVFLGEEDVFGRVAEGLRAELVLLDANPLQDLSNTREIAGVIRRGVWYPRSQIEEVLAEIAARHAE